ncbi:MAG: serine/threonine-protein kinase [Bryobacterales bacterium]|nr:serine/threonine-protein kinase [Bryobacterales bacterium]
MPLSVGDKLGPYEILSPLGAGGMGEVYKARDTRLDRSVAVKVLPEHIAKREDLRARFEREARAVASLNHPRICVLHDIGSHDGAAYMVMELLDGETLGARIAKGAIPLEQALAVAVQIADALDRAHRAGVTHRDVKPDNIMLTRDGVKVLDFGLAKPPSGKPGPSEETLTQALTAEGTVLGTPQYMAPEQFEGREADARSDVWAFGAVLYEMVTGRKAFQGKSYASLVGAILGGEPAPMAVKPFTPVWLERLVRRCLSKDPEERWQSMRDIAFDLQSPPSEAGAPARTSRWLWVVAAACLAVAALAAGWTLGSRKTPEPALPVRFLIDWPEGTTAGTGWPGIAISPDGRTLAFAATTEQGESALYVRPLELLEARALPGTEGAQGPFWSPDSKSVAFVARGKLKRVEVAGGPPVTLCDARVARGGTWNEDGVIVFGDHAPGLQRVSASGGTPAAVTRVNREAGETAHYFPQFLPGGRQFLYFVLHQRQAEAGIYVASLDGKPETLATLILRTPAKAEFDAGSGRLLYVHRAGRLMARRLALDPPRLGGEPATVAEALAVNPGLGYAQFSVSRNSTLFYGQRARTAEVRFSWRDRAGRILETIERPVVAIYSFNLSPDDRRVAYWSGEFGQSDIWVLDLVRKVNTRVTSSGTAGAPRWSPDGKRIYYNDQSGIRRKMADGSGEDELLMKPMSGLSDFVNSVSPDEKHLLFGLNDMTLLPLTAERKPEPYLQTEYQERGARFSPDGRWVAYRSDETGRQEIYVQGFPERRGKWPVSAEGGLNPEWRADGKELYWVGLDGMLTAASVELQAASVRVGRAEALFRRLPGETYFQVGRDGQRFLVREREHETRERPMVVIQNWEGRLGK